MEKLARQSGWSVKGPGPRTCWAGIILYVDPYMCNTPSKAARGGRLASWEVSDGVEDHRNGF